MEIYKFSPANWIFYELGKKCLFIESSIGMKWISPVHNTMYANRMCVCVCVCLPATFILVRNISVVQKCNMHTRRLLNKSSLVPIMWIFCVILYVKCFWRRRYEYEWQRRFSVCLMKFVFCFLTKENPGNAKL